MERAEANRKISESVNYIWPNRDFVMVCDRPKEINRNEQGRLHNRKGKSIEYKDGWGLYHLNGVKFDEETYYKVTADYEDKLLPIPVGWKLSPKEKAAFILAIEDVDQRTQAMAFLEPQKLIDALNGKIVDSYTKIASNGKEVKYILYTFPKGDIFTQNAFYAYFTCPSTDKEHLEGVIESKTVPEAMSWRDDTTEEEWKSRVPMVHET